VAKEAMAEAEVSEESAQPEVTVAVVALPAMEDREATVERGELVEQAD
jgi:hypothetical protein